MAIITGPICRAARGLLNCSIPRLARDSGVSVQVIFDLERDRSPRVDDLVRLERAFRNAGVVVLVGERGGVGVCFADVKPQGLTVSDGCTLAACHHPDVTARATVPAPQVAHDVNLPESRDDQAD